MFGKGITDWIPNIPYIYSSETPEQKSRMEAIDQKQAKCETDCYNEPSTGYGYDLDISNSCVRECEKKTAWSKKEEEYLRKYLIIIL